jgi:AcrR family transcriptional regulator
MIQSRRTQADRSDQTRDGLIRAAAKIIAQNGYAEATLQQIADEAGMSKGAIHHHFKSKLELIAPVLKHCSQIARQRVISTWEVPRSPAERLRATLRALWLLPDGSSLELAALAELLQLSGRDSRVRSVVLDVLAPVEREIAGGITAALKELGMHSRVPVQTIPPLVISLLAGLTVQRGLNRLEDLPDYDRMGATLETLAFSLFTF